MGRITFFALGVMLAVTACGVAAQFNYRYYSVGADHYEGVLRGPTEKDDLPFSTCKPSQGKAAPCIAMLKDPYLQLKADYLDLQNKLSACQRGQ